MKAAKQKPVIEDVMATLDRMDDYTMPVEHYIQRCFGRRWKFDPYANEYVIPDPSHSGAGRGFIIISAETSREQRIVLAEHQIN